MAAAFPCLFVLMTDCRDTAYPLPVISPTHSVLGLCKYFPPPTTPHWFLAWFPLHQAFWRALKPSIVLEWSLCHSAAWCIPEMQAYAMSPRTSPTPKAPMLYLMVCRIIFHYIITHTLIILGRAEVGGLLNEILHLTAVAACNCNGQVPL